ncbi:hypothetical protein D3C78_1474790 [compost metagenome]
MMPLRFSQSQKAAPDWRFQLSTSPALVWPRNCEMVAGKISSELAKMSGMTPPWFTRSGMYCWPAGTRPPVVVRLADCTGMRRWPS